jgi:hypothetical protein
MRIILVVITMLLAVSSSHAEVFTGENQNKPLTIHGRLSCYNGGSTFRIWIVGSKRMLYIAGDQTPALEKINKFFSDGDGWFTREVFADFTVEPLASETKGHMRPVRILDIKRVVITREGNVIAQIDEL